MPSPRLPVLFGLAAAFALAPGRAAARGDVPRACVEAVERGQSLRDKVKLRQARAAFLSCAAPTCPEVIQRDCAQWVTEIDVRIPTVIITASDAAGHDVVYVRVLVDGEPFAERLDGIAVPIDPGIHTFRLEPTSGPPIEQTVVVREAEKYQKEHFTIQAQAQAAMPAVSPPPVLPVVPVVAPVVRPAPGALVPVGLAPSPPPSSDEPSSSRSGYKTGAVVAGSVAGIAALSFLTFAIVGTVDVHDLHSCAPGCNPDSVDRAKRELMAADISLGVGAVALGVATWLYFEWRAGRSSRTSAASVPPSLVFHF
jgi:hypothetical protein